MKFTYLESRNASAWTRLPSGLYQSTDDIYVTLQGSDGLRYFFHIFPGFQTDGGSVPVAFRWFVPAWSEGNEIINLAYVLHDYLYGSEALPKDIADDLLRGMLRDAGLSRFRASTVCWAVEKFARSHYGITNDRLDCALFGELRICR